MFVCAIPSMVSYLALIILPESPKFELSQGRQEQTIQILEKMNRWNNGGKSAEPLGITEIHEEKAEIENRLRQQEQKQGSFTWMKSMWAQTALLFKPPLLTTTLLACTIQFGIFATGNGFYMWFAEILNRLGNNLDDFTSVRIPICEVISNTRGMNWTETAEPVGFFSFQMLADENIIENNGIENCLGVRRKTWYINTGAWTHVGNSVSDWIRADGSCDQLRGQTYIIG